MLATQSPQGEYVSTIYKVPSNVDIWVSLRLSSGHLGRAIYVLPDSHRKALSEWFWRARANRVPNDAPPPAWAVDRHAPTPTRVGRMWVSAHGERAPPSSINKGKHRQEHSMAIPSTHAHIDTPEQLIRP